MEEKSIKTFTEMYPKYNTKKAYRSAIYDFLDFFNTGRVRAGKAVSSDEKTKYEDLCKRYFSEDRHFIVDLIGFLSSMNGKPPATIKLKMAAVREWFEFNDVELTYRELKTLRNKMPRAKGSWTVEHEFDKEILQKILSHTDEKGRALILTLASSGIRIGEAISVTLDDLNLSKTPAEIVVRGEYNKGGETRVTFISAEAKAAIEEWLKVRENYIKSALNRNRGLIEKAEAKPKDGNDKRLFPFSDGVVRELWARALTKTGVYEKDSATNRLQYRVHGLRKFFRSNLALSCPQDIVEALLGHSTYLSSAYRRYTKKQMGEYYLNSEAHVTIAGSGDIKKITKELQDTEAKVEGYRSIMTKQAEETAELRGEVEEMGGMVKAMEEAQKAKEPYEEGVTMFFSVLKNKPEIRKAVIKEIVGDPGMIGAIESILKKLKEDKEDM